MRISLAGEVLICREEPLVSPGGVPVVLPPGAFLQATKEGEAALQATVQQGVAGAKRVLDAFCGLGTFTLPLARSAHVTAIDADDAALDALAGAVNRTRHLKPVTITRRDLIRHPLGSAELEAFDAVVFDPPRKGAEGLARALAKAKNPVATIVAVSCEPTTLARDCAILVEGGYTITHVQPIDQFVATAHIETVAWLRRTG